MLFIAAKARFIGIPLALLVTSWFFKYAYILFDHTARGFDEPPTLDIQMMNPVDEQRPLGQVLILCIVGALLYYAHAYIGTPAALALGVVCLFFLPASAAILGLESHLLKAANPVEWLSLVRGLGLLGIQERVARLGGTCEIQSKPGVGAKIAIELPLASGAGGKPNDQKGAHQIEDHPHPVG